MVTAAALALLSSLSTGQGPAPGPELLGGAEAGPALTHGAWVLELRPSVGLSASPDFAVSLAPALRFTSPSTARLRDEDWDERADFGQLLQSLTAGGPDRPMRLRAGELRGLTLGRGHLVSGYFNRLSEDYHPAGAQLLAFAGPMAFEVVASDVLAARLFAAAARYATPDGRFHAGSFSGLHDFGRAGGAAPSLSLAQLDADVGLLRGERLSLDAVLGGGARVGVGDPAFGGVLGLSADGRLGAVALGGRLELRRVQGGYRPGLVGPDYELARFAGTGFAGAPVADERLPGAFSGFLEGQVEASGRGARVVGQAAVEVFTFGRTDARAWASAELLSGWVTGSALVDVVGLGAAPRALVAGEARVRLLPSLYAAARAGTSFRPAPGGGLERAVTAGVAIGADFDASLVPR